MTERDALEHLTECAQSLRRAAMSAKYADELTGRKLTMIFVPVKGAIAACERVIATQLAQLEKHGPVQTSAN